jgi:hypothetical protein
LNTRYVIRRTDASVCRGWYWGGGGCWTDVADDARTFEFVTNAALTGIAECPLPLPEWDVVPVESQAAPKHPRRHEREIVGLRAPREIVVNIVENRIK